MKALIVSVATAALLVCTCTARANVPTAYEAIAQQFGVPADVLYAIALTESRMQVGRNLTRPWPWTANVEGKPYRFNTRAELTAFLRQQLQQGNSRFDVGLMQISWRHHGKRFTRLEDAIDPITNVQAGADYLRYLLKKTGSLEKAIGMYHTGEAGPVPRQKFYRQLVLKALEEIHRGEV
jgi:soluble lytic murein transglycosylase-like protein